MNGPLKLFGILETFFFTVTNAILEYSKFAKSINVEMSIFIDKHCVSLRPYEIEEI